MPIQQRPVQIASFRTPIANKDVLFEQIAHEITNTPSIISKEHALVAAAKVLEQGKPDNITRSMAKVSRQHQSLRGALSASQPTFEQAVNFTVRDGLLMGRYLALAHIKLQMLERNLG